jgi:hypothetical protein
MQNKQELKSISVFVSLEKIESNLSEIGFSINGTTTIVADGKFWKKMLYIRVTKELAFQKKLAMLIQKIQLLRFVRLKTLFQKLLME